MPGEMKQAGPAIQLSLLLCRTVLDKFSKITAQSLRSISALRAFSDFMRVSWSHFNRSVFAFRLVMLDIHVFDVLCVDHSMLRQLLEKVVLRDVSQVRDGAAGFSAEGG